MKCCLLLWSDWVKRSIFEEIIDIVVVDLDVGHKNAVTAVFIHILRFTRLFGVDHISQLWVSLLPKINQKNSITFKMSFPSNIVFKKKNINSTKK